MSVFEYVMVLVSVVLSLGLVHLLTGAAMLVRNRRRVRWSFVHALWMVEGVSIHLDLWTSLWLMHGDARWSFASILLAMLSAAMTYFTAALLVPEQPGDGVLDLWEYHMAHRREYLLAFMGYVVSAVAINLSIMPASYGGVLVSLVFAAPAMLIYAVPWLSANRWIQRVAPVLILALDAYYFATNFATIG